MGLAFAYHLGCRRRLGNWNGLNWSIAERGRCAFTLSCRESFLGLRLLLGSLDLLSEARTSYLLSNALDLLLKKIHVMRRKNRDHLINCCEFRAHSDLEDRRDQWCHILSFCFLFAVTKYYFSLRKNEQFSLWQAIRMSKRVCENA